MTEFNKTMDMINNQLNKELCNKLSNPKYLTEFTSVTYYDNVKNMLYSLATDFINTSINNFEYASYSNYLYTVDGYVNIDDIRLDEPIFILESNGEILDADVDYFNIIFNTGFEDSLNKKGKQVLKDYEELSKLLTQFENDRNFNTLCESTLYWINEYANDWIVIEDFAIQLENYAEGHLL